MRKTMVGAAAFVVLATTLGPAASADATTATISPSDVRVTFHQVASGFSSPVSVTSARDGSRRLFVVEQGGSVRVVKNGTVQSKSYLNISSEVQSGGEQGLLSITFHPHFRAHPFVYAAYTVSSGALHVSRFKASSASATSVAASTERLLLTVPHPTYQNHNGGQLLFGPSGFLLITTGDGGGGGDPFANAEDLTSKSGKILRIDVDHSCGSHHYCIPKRNPFSGARNGNKRLVFDWGLRNPWRASIDRANGSLWIGDVGQDKYEEVDHVFAGGKDFGWSCREAFWSYNTSRCSGRHMTKPVRAYTHANNRCAIIGGYVYRGPSYRFAHGLYLSGDYCNGQVWAIGRTSSGGYPRAQVTQISGNLSGFGEGDAGEIYAVTLGGGLFHVVFHKR